MFWHFLYLGIALSILALNETRHFHCFFSECALPTKYCSLYCITSYFLHHMIYCGSQEFTALFLILSTGPSVVFPLLLDAGNNCVPVIFSSKTESRKVLTSDIFVILEFIEFCQHAGGFYRTDTHPHCPSLLQSDLTPGNQCRQRLSNGKR